MRTLEDRLTHASDEARRQVDKINIRPASAVGRRVHQRRTLVGAGAVALIFGAFGATALLVGTGVESASGAGAGEVTPPTTTTDVVDVTTAPVDQTDVSGLARLALTDEGWAVVEALDAGSGTTLIYEGDPAIYGGQAGEPRLSIEVWSDIPGEDAGSGYQRALESILLNEEPLADAISGDGNTARSFTFTDPNTGSTGFYFLWQHSETVSVEVIVYVDDFDHAKNVLSLIERIKESGWSEILDGQPSDAGVTTTTLAPSGG